MLITRPPHDDDILPLLEVLNRIIAAGGTTAYETPLTAEELADTFLTGPEVICATVVATGGVAIGFQTLARHPELEPGWADISTFTRRDAPVRGAGAALFRVTLELAHLKGIAAINASIRADNQGGLRYYHGLGFRPYGVSAAVLLADGRPVDRLHHRLLLAHSTAPRQATSAADIPPSSTS